VGRADTGTLREISEKGSPPPVVAFIARHPSTSTEVHLCQALRTVLSRGGIVVAVGASERMTAAAKRRIHTGRLSSSSERRSRAAATATCRSERGRARD